MCSDDEEPRSLSKAIEVYYWKVLIGQNVLTSGFPADKVLVFNDDGNATHIHNAVYEAFPSLQSHGGYTFMVSSEKSLIPIEMPKCSLKVHYLYLSFGTVSAIIAPRLKCYKNASRLNRYTFPTDNAIDFLVSTLHSENSVV